MSFSYTNSESFTLTNAKYLASKVAADLKRIQRFYDKPSDSDVNNYEIEITAFLHNGYLEKVTYGFQRHGKWIPPTIIYTAQDLIGSSSDDDPGRIVPGADVSGAVFTSYLSYADAWNKLTSEEKTKFKKSLPFQRRGAAEPGINGYISSDRTYTSGGKSLNRSSVKKH